MQKKSAKQLVDFFCTYPFYGLPDLALSDFDYYFANSEAAMILSNVGAFTVVTLA